MKSTKQPALRWVPQGDIARVMPAAMSGIERKLLYCESDHVYLWKSFVLPQLRRQGIAHNALRWLWWNEWPNKSNQPYA